MNTSKQRNFKPRYEAMMLLTNWVGFFAGAYVAKYDPSFVMILVVAIGSGLALSAIENLILWKYFAPLKKVYCIEINGKIFYRDEK